MVGFFSSPQMVVVDVSVEEEEASGGEGMPLLICYDSSTRRHSIWSIQQATREVSKLNCRSSLLKFHPVQNDKNFYAKIYLYQFNRKSAVIITFCYRRFLPISQLLRDQRQGQTHHKTHSAPLLLVAMETKPHPFP